MHCMMNTGDIRTKVHIRNRLRHRGVPAPHHWFRGRTSYSNAVNVIELLKPTYMRKKLIIRKYKKKYKLYIKCIDYVTTNNIINSDKTIIIKTKTF